MNNMWEMMKHATECDCTGSPPPEFMLPPPPRPPIPPLLQPVNSIYCTENTLPIETCEIRPLIDPSYRSSPSFQSSAVIFLVAVLLGLFVFIFVILVWKHKRKVQNFIPCKNPNAQNNCDGPNSANVIYDDIHDVIARPTPNHYAVAGHIVAPSIEMRDVKNNLQYNGGYSVPQHQPVFLYSTPHPDQYCSQELYNPIYEELSDGESEYCPTAIRSEDEFAEDELSLGGDVQGHKFRMRLQTERPRASTMNYNNRPPKSQQHRPRNSVIINSSSLQGGNKRDRDFQGGRQQQQEFHEGMLLDALLQLYPRIGSIEPVVSSAGSRLQIPNITQRIQCISPTSLLPYDPIHYPGGHLSTSTTFRNIPKPYSQDSAFGSDSGYSNHTVDFKGPSTNNRDRRERVDYQI